MILTVENLKDIAAQVNSESRKERRLNDYHRFLFYHGKSKGIIKSALEKEFTSETVKALMSRIVTLNITKKIVNKLAGVYLETPKRKVADGSETDQQLLGKFEDTLKINITMKEANRYFKLSKRIMVELYLDEEGKPRSRALPAHTYEVFSFSKKDPGRLDVVVIIQNDDINKDVQRMDVWTNDSFYTIDGNGKVIIEGRDYETPIEERNQNAYGALPFFYKCENSLGVDPIEEDDLIQMATVIPVILTDLLFGLKYQTFSIVYTVGVKGDVNLNPNSIVSLDYDADGNEPKIETVKANFDSDKILTVVYNLVQMLLSVNNLSSPIARSSLNASDPVSGISKILDSAESVENKKDQQDFFYDVETAFWEFIAKKGIPTWKKTKQINSDFIKAFSEAFAPVIQFMEPKAMISDKEKIETLKSKQELKAITRKDIIRELYPDMDDKAIEQYIKEIDDEQASAPIKGIVKEGTEEESVDG